MGSRARPSGVRLMFAVVATLMVGMGSAFADSPSAALWPSRSQEWSPAEQLRSPPEVAGPSVWPLPASMQSGSGTVGLDPAHFEFVISDECRKWSGSDADGDAAVGVRYDPTDVLREAFDRYRAIIFNNATASMAMAAAAASDSQPFAEFDATDSADSGGDGNGDGYGGAVRADRFGGAVPIVPRLIVCIRDDPNADLQLGVSEWYTLSVPDSAQPATLIGATVFGCLRGLETFAQLIDSSAAHGAPPSQWTYRIAGIAPVLVEDSPRFPHRGLLIDSARHFLPLSTIKQVIDGMAADKLNTLHWHLTDVQSIPFAPDVVPALANLSAGAWAPYLRYTRDDLKHIVRYGLYRGIRIVPEIDSPAHTLSWTTGIPALLPCPGIGYTSALDPSIELTYEVVDAVVGSLAEIFFDEYFHFGGDEVFWDCWNASASIVQWMADNGFAAGDFRAVMRYYIGRVQSIAAAHERHAIWWEEVGDHYGPGPVFPTPPPANLWKNSTVQIWFYPGWNWWNMTDVVVHGFQALRSDAWYLNNAGQTWTSVYASDPLTNGTCDYATGQCSCSPCFNITDPALVKRVLGGEACAWGETIDDGNLIPTLWPSLSAVAERLWSAQTVNDAAAALPRLVDQRCRLKRRGIRGTPLGPGFC